MSLRLVICSAVAVSSLNHPSLTLGTLNTLGYYRTLKGPSQSTDPSNIVDRDSHLAVARSVSVHVFATKALQSAPSLRDGYGYVSIPLV